MENKIDPYYTHIPILSLMVYITNGPILELGCGFGSTPLLHYLCYNRKLISAENSKEWIDIFQKRLSSDKHTFLFINNWEEISKINEILSVVFVDNSPPGARGKCIELLFDKADYFVLHDVNELTNNEVKIKYDYGYENIFPKFKFRWDFKYFNVWSSVISNKYELSWLDKIKGTEF
jgi:hypothetical protein